MKPNILVEGEVSRGQARRSNSSQHLFSFDTSAFIFFSSISPSSKKMYKVNVPRYILRRWTCEIPRLFILNKHKFARPDKVKIKEYTFFCRTKSRQAWENYLLYCI